MIPLLITMDLEIACDYNLIEQGTILYKLCSDLNKLGLPVTVFATSESVNIFPDQVNMLQSYKNEIGCHGLNHGKNENYKKIPEKIINENINEAGKIIEDKIQNKPVCFRGPRMTTSTVTQKILINNGYIADFSVCSQRMDFLNSKGGDVRWLFAPRLPYNPSGNSPYKKGNLPIWIIPLSSIGFPFISGILYLFGLEFMKSLFRLLVKESLKNKKPIVYLMHSYEFTQYTGQANRKSENDDVKRNKRSLIHNLYISDPVKRYNMNLELFKYMLSFDLIYPITGKEYCKHLNGETA